MSSASDFNIKNGILEKYTGKGGDVTIPDGVTSIGDWAFSDCTSLTGVTIPNSVTSIGKSAFINCTSLKSVTLPDNVTSIGKSAFYCCTSLTSVTIPDVVTGIKWGAFSNTALMNDESKWKDDVLYVGNNLIKAKRSLSGEYSVRPGTRLIADGAFEGCTGLTSVTIPDGVTSIGEGAFRYCENMTNVTIGNGVTEIGANVFSGCKSLFEVTIERKNLTPMLFYSGGRTVRLHLIEENGSVTVSYACFRKDNPYHSGAYLHKSDLLLPGGDEDTLLFDYLIAVGKHDGFTMSENGRIGAAIQRMLEKDRPIKSDLLPAIREFLSGKISKVVEYAAKNNCEGNIRLLITYGVITDENKLKVSKNLEKIGGDAADVAAKLEELMSASRCISSDGGSTSDGIGNVEKLIVGDRIFEKEYGLPQPAVLLADGSGNAPESYLIDIIKGYREGEGIVKKADKIAAKLDRDSLVKALTKVFDSQVTKKAKLKVIDALFRFAPGNRIAALYKEVYSEYYEYEVNAALILNDSKDAIMLADKLHILDEYAQIRKIDEETLRDTILADFGLNADGSKKYDLGTKTVSVSLMPDLSLALLDDSNGKTVKSIPKKNAEPEKYADAKADFDQLKKNVKKVVVNRVNYLLESFRSGKEFEIDRWKSVYLENPVLNHVARLIVWSQGKKTFTLRGTTPIDSSGMEYTLTDNPVKVAHPMEMKPADVTAWQNYFTFHGLKQPFQQIWEPVRDPNTVKEDRYAGIMIPYYRFLRQEKHGITVYDNDFHNDIWIDLKDCLSYVERVDWRSHDIRADDDFEIQKFTFKKYTRQVNHIVAYLDRITVFGRIRKDDVTVAELLDGFTAAQISEFIKTATEANAVNVTALLLEYKNAHYPDLDPLAEFTLDF